MPKYTESVLLPLLHITPLDEDIALYAIRSTRRDEQDKSLEFIAKTFTSGEVIMHPKAQCCDFAGNKGFTCGEFKRLSVERVRQVLRR